MVGTRFSVVGDLHPLSGAYTPGLAFTAMGVTNNNVALVMRLTTNGAPRNTTLNGTLQVLGSTNAAGIYTNIVSAEMPRATFSGNGEVRTNVPVAIPLHFYKARIVTPL